MKSFLMMFSFQTGVFDIVSCLSQCRSLQYCTSVNYETGLCVLFNSTGSSLPGIVCYLIFVSPLFGCLHSATCTNHLSTVTWCFSLYQLGNNSQKQKGDIIVLCHRLLLSLLLCSPQLIMFKQRHILEKQLRRF